MKTIDFVIPLYNEEDGLLGFQKLLEATALPEGYSRRYIFVNDGSTDRTAELLDSLAASDSRIKVIHLSRNFGHQAALSAGLDIATADVVISMDDMRASQRKWRQANPDYWKSCVGSGPSSSCKEQRFRVRGYGVL
jgi:GT2 family glycosyltransferase